MSVPSFDQLLARLVEADIRFVVIGGLALGTWGVIRGTKDCDIVPDPAPENLDKLARLVADDTLASVRSVVAPELPGTTRMIEAARLKARAPIALGDCFAVTTAAAHDLVLLTGDPEIVDLPDLPCQIEDLRAPEERCRP